MNPPRKAMKLNIVRVATGWALSIAGIFFALMSLQDGGPYEAMKVFLLAMAFFAAGLFLLVDPPGTARAVGLSLGAFALVLMGTVALSYEAGGSLGHPMLDIVLTLFVATYGGSLFAMTRHVIFSEKKVPGLEPGKKIRG